MRIALVGIGKMGKLIGKIAREKGYKIVAEIGSENRHDLGDLSSVSPDVAIEFTSPESALENFKSLAKQGIPTVTGTTGWHGELAEVSSWFSKGQTPFFYASNFSIGVHISIATSNFLAQIMNRFPEYQLGIEEWHHTEKKDAPSGTAITFADEITKHLKKYSSFSVGKAQKEGQIPIQSYREGDIKGRHKIKYESNIDRISLEHEALNRNGFAIGALSAAEFLKDQAPGTYSMNDLLNINK